ncbi:VapC toxin family PIN domain ribonuclease [Caulobacter radicis]|uniref:type II toxin-antitoxin system VapC family toxin n=1 Tax=Caulobacter radicis TaxID=2172650 RepID=UPI000D5710C5|nr:type II toxin-antitoxin system VapC family toxin [Caulobacter radicis]PVM84045.1 VapC toxin family PIN domain ribonuclease [Caulobacter radicis]
MILVDSSVWVAHLRAADAVLVRLLEESRVLVHPFVVGELALGNLKNRTAFLEALRQMPMATSATDAEVFDFVEGHRLYGRGIGHVDAHLLAAVRLTAGARLWTQDQRLEGVARDLGLEFRPPA